MIGAPKGSISDKIHHSTRWKKLARHVIVEQPVCCDPYWQHCDEYRSSQSAHHIVAIEVNPDLAWDFENLVGLCFKCHIYVEMLEGRGISTVAHVRQCRGVVRQLVDKPSEKTCFRLTADQIYCARMNFYKTSPCGPCNLYATNQKSAATPAASL